MRFAYVPVHKYVLLDSDNPEKLPKAEWAKANVSDWFNHFASWCKDKPNEQELLELIAKKALESLKKTDESA